jgi:hypothetical protein
MPNLPGRGVAHSGDDTLICPSNADRLPRTLNKYSGNLSVPPSKTGRVLVQGAAVLRLGGA